MISENIRNLSASWAQTCALQISRKAGSARTAPKPRGSDSCSRRADTATVLTLPPKGGGHLSPLLQRQRLGPARGVDPQPLEAFPGLRRRLAADPRQRSAQLFSAELEDAADEVEERLEVVDVD